jgi:DMSO/TMAO reductase YedYZ molybdopterin-dependent catalytic subunit
MSQLNRRELLQGLLTAGLTLDAAMLAWPALAQGEEVVPFTDIPAPAPNAARRPPTLQSFLTPPGEFFSVQHYNVPTVDPATYRLRVDGLAERPLELTLSELRARPRMEQIVGFECSGNNNARGNPLIGNARWAGTSLSALLGAARPAPTAREVVFFGADGGPEEITHGGAPVPVEQHFARSLSLEDARRPEVMIAYEMNGEPLPQGHGAPVRLIVPGWYGVANVKWLTRINLQDSRFMGRFMARDYVTLRDTGGPTEPTWNESSVSRIRLKSAIGRVTRSGSALTAVGFALTDGTALRAVEVRLDDGPWQPATFWTENTPYSWKLFRHTWPNVGPGDHTLVSRAIDVNGLVQLEADDPTKKTRWENHAQFVRKIRIG